MEKLGKLAVEDVASKLLKLVTGCPKPTENWVPSLHRELLSPKLQTTLLALVRQLNNHSQKKPQVIKEPDPFSRGSPEELYIFVFQYQIYFCTCKGEFINDTNKVFLAILYLHGIALDYFKPFINEPNLYHNLDFLEDWSVFVQKLSNIFSSYSPEDDNENMIVSIPFPSDSKAVNYFICFVKYQNYICWNKRTLCKVVKDTILNCIQDKLYYSQENVLFFEGFKRAVLWIDSNYWKRV